MKPRHFLALFAVVLGSVLVGCSSGGDDGSANVNKDVQTGTPPPGLEGGAAAGGGGGAPSGGGSAPATPSTGA
ncbi:MAG TPA: hypothetical protein VK171_08910 [Fimbriimonas sp.]|nr:hypothetical protein [Fimbriimonas sp.]